MPILRGGGVLTPAEIDKIYEVYNLVKGSNFALKSDCFHFRNARARMMLVDIFKLEYVNTVFFKENLSAFEQVFNMLEDEFSKETMFRYLEMRFKADVSCVQEVVATPTYFPQGVYSLPTEPCFIDCGAYNGDTVAVIVKRYPDYRKILCFEPSPSNFKALEDRIRRDGLRDVKSYNKGCSDRDELLRFTEEDDSHSNRLSDEGQIQVHAVKLDDYMPSDPVSLIKMDIEGAELSALMGARKTIVRDRPVLAISMYHKKEDFMTIPQYLKRLVPDYKYYLRLHGILCELVLYAVPPEHEFRGK